jgi:histone chaperone ASF1
MQLVQLDNIAIENPRARPNDPLSFAVTFSALQPLPHPLTWKVIYVGSAFSETYDQNL